MSWGTSFKPVVFISRKEFNTIGELELEISEVQRRIKGNRERLLMFGISVPDTINTDPDYDTIEYIHSGVSILLDELEEDTRLLVYLELLKDNWGTKV